MKRCVPFVFVMAILLSSCSSDNSSSEVGGPADALESTAIYQVVAGDLSLSLQTGGETQAADTDTWNAVVELLPQDTLRSHVVEYHIFSDGEDETLAYVSQLEGDATKWMFSVDSADAVNKESKSFVTTVTHEFAHILALNSEQVAAGVEEENCAREYWVEEGCPKESATILAYFDEYWKGSLYNQHQQMVADLEGDEKADAVADFYDQHQEKFINEYSATDPVEDFAETFSYFVFVDRINPAHNLREQKINFFYDYPALVSVRDHIRAQTTIRRDNIDDQNP